MVLLKLMFMFSGTPPSVADTLTGFLIEVKNVVVGTAQLSDQLSVILFLGKPPVARKTECFIKDVISHIHVVNIPARSWA